MTLNSSVSGWLSFTPFALNSSYSLVITLQPSDYQIFTVYLKPNDTAVEGNYTAQVIGTYVGGQGILTIAASIGMAALQQNLFLKQAEVHGMSQRGGSVHSDLRISDKKIASDLIPLGEADLIISVEPMEALRYLPYLAADGWLVTNSCPFPNITDYPDIEQLTREIKQLQHHIELKLRYLFEFHLIRFLVK